MRTRLTLLMCLLAVTLTGLAHGNVYINGRSVSTTNFRVVWSTGADVEAITELYWMGGQNLTGSYSVGACNNGDVEYFGNAWVPPDPQAGGQVLVGGGTTGGTWASSFQGKGGNTGNVQIHSTSSGCSPSSANVAVNTTYLFDDSPGNQNHFAVQRQFSFGNKVFPYHFRPYIPRLSLGLDYTQVLYPAIGGVLATVDARNCPTGCTGPFSVPGAAALDAEWDSSQQWYAIHNPTTGKGVVVMRQRARDADGSIIQSQLWVDWDGGSNSNSSSFLLMSPTSMKNTGGFGGSVTENETFCFYESNSWTPSMTPPTACQPTDNSDWPQPLHDGGKTGYNPGEQILHPWNVGGLQQQFAIPDLLPPFPGNTPLAVSNGMLYTFTDFGTGPNIYAFDAVTGEWLPSFRAPTLSYCLYDPSGVWRLLVDRGILYVNCGYESWHGSLHLLDAKTGAEIGPDYFTFYFEAAKDGWIYGTFGGGPNDEAGAMNILQNLGWSVFHPAICQMVPAASTRWLSVTELSALDTGRDFLVQEAWLLSAEVMAPCFLT